MPTGAGADNGTAPLELSPTVTDLPPDDAPIDADCDVEQEKVRAAVD